MEKNSSEILQIIKENYPLKNINKLHRERLSMLEKLALFVTQKIGSMGFFILIISWTIIWISWNTMGPEQLRFDPSPAFVLWLFISNLIQLHLLPLLLIGQNIQNKHQELRAEHDFETDKKAEAEIEAILMHLEKQQEINLKMLKKIEKLEEKNS